jgi:tRNA-dihydrouridine synthase A
MKNSLRPNHRRIKTPIMLTQFPRFAVAPMMDWTDRHCRFFHRLLTRKAVLYTEMVTSAAIKHGARDRLLGFDQAEHPLIVQLGGSNPGELAEAAKIAEGYGYTEINLNVGCPSDRVQEGRFGACLMQEPQVVAECITAMKAAVSIPVSVKCRIGIDDQDPEQALNALADEVIAAGCDSITVHARKAWLKGLSPKENREVPPLDYPLVYALKKRLGDYPIGINGGITSFADIREHVSHVDGVMIGREAYHNPEMLLAVDPELYGVDAPVFDAFEALEAYHPYIEARMAEGIALHSMTRHLLGLFQGRPGARAFRRHLATEGVKKGATLQALKEAVALIDRSVEQAA